MHFTSVQASSSFPVQSTLHIDLHFDFHNKYISQLGLLGAARWQGCYRLPERKVKSELAITPGYFTTTMEANLAAKSIFLVISEQLCKMTNLLKYSHANYSRLFVIFVKRILYIRHDSV